MKYPIGIQSFDRIIEDGYVKDAAEPGPEPAVKDWRSFEV